MTDLYIAHIYYLVDFTHTPADVIKIQGLYYPSCLDLEKLKKKL